MELFNKSILKNGLAVAVSLALGMGCSNTIDGGADPAVDAAVAPEPPTETCEEIAEITFTRSQTKPDVMLVVDRSASMERSAGGAASKWAVMLSAISSIVVGTGELEFGLQVFPTRGACGVDDIQVAPSQRGGIEVLQALAPPTAPGGDTPTYHALESVRRHFAGLSASEANPDGQVILLATDGRQTCGDRPAIESIRNLYSTGTKTYVLGFDFTAADSDPDLLQNMAVAGGTGQHYTADSAQELGQALEDIIEDVTSPSCTFQLDNIPHNVDDIEIEIAGFTVEQSASDGWSYSAAANTVNLKGEACEMLKNSGAGDVSVGLGCAEIIIE